MDSTWSLEDSAELYLIDRWGAPYFSINDAGNLAFLAPAGQAKLDIKHLIDDLRARGIAAPILLRFNDILQGCVADINHCFARAIQEYGYLGDYRGVMPIKVNQQRHVVEELLRHGEPFRLGLEAGSKPELLVAIAMLNGQGAWLVCNGYKDAEYIEMALYAQTLGLVPFIVLDRFEELELVLNMAHKVGVRPNIGVRAKLSTRGSGRWKDSTGDRSKFGLSAQELVAAHKRLKNAGMLDCLKLLHFHIGSQITAIKSVKDALREAMQLYCNLREMGATELNVVDCGGGLAIDYDGSRTNFHSSMNYSRQEYANDVVATLQSICDHNKMPHPTIVTESGRALVAQHSVLIFDVLGVHSFGRDIDNHEALVQTSGEHDVIVRMRETYHSVNRRTFQEAYNDIIGHKEESTTLFSHGVIDLKTRARAEALFWATCRRISQVLAKADFVPDDLRHLAKEISDTYYCNFSVFQSLPDAWAVGHLFPVAPIHRLEEEPEREAILADLTCDSDGKLDRFIDLRDVRHTLRLHAPDGKPYYLGAFLVGAYQEILGDLHNLFGDTNAVHVNVNADGSYTLDHLVAGDSVQEVLGYVKYDAQELIRRVKCIAEAQVVNGHFSAQQFGQFMRLYEAGLRGYTYLEDIV